MKKYFCLLGFLSFLSISAFAQEQETLVIEDFNGGAGNAKAAYGAWNPFEGDVTQGISMEIVEDDAIGPEGYSVELDYDVDSPNPAYNGSFVKLTDIDLSGYSAVTFYAKGYTKRGYTKQFNIELKNKNGDYARHLVRGITDSWQKFTVPLAKMDKFNRKGTVITEMSFKDMDEMVIVFDDIRATKKVGTIFIDQIGFEK